MPTLKESALTYKGKKDLTDLDKIDVNLEFKSSTFKNSEGKEMAFNYIEIDGYKYTIKAKIMQQIQQIVAARPQTKFIKIQKAPNGDTYVIPLD